MKELFDIGAQTDRLPPWLRLSLPKGGGLMQTCQGVKRERLHTVCEEAKCPNRLECYSRQTATFLALGKSCTRACGFCEIDFAHTPPPPDPDEPSRILRSAEAMGLTHVVVTMVARDDLVDHGAGHMAAIVDLLHSATSPLTVELLISDLAGDPDALDKVLLSTPEILNHNMETVERLSSRVRHKATYQRSLELLTRVAQRSQPPLVKSGLMLGLGEEPAEVRKSLVDMQESGCQIVTLGQYLRPSKKKLRVKSYVRPEQFEEYAQFGRDIGIEEVYAGPFVRSSYNADQVRQRLITRREKEGIG